MWINLTFFDRLFNRHKFVRRVMVVWAMATITWTTWMLFRDASLITPASAAAYATNVGLLATVLGCYQWGRNNEDTH